MEQSKLVYIVDDNTDLAETLAIMLRNKGYKVYIASTAEVALNLIKETQSRQATIFMDLDLGGPIDGAALLGKILEDNPYLTVTVFMSGKSDADGKVKALAAGAVAYEMKPVTIKLLEDYIESAVVEQVAREQFELRQKAAEAPYDSLTGLLNLGGFINVARGRLAQAQHMGRPMALLYLDLDNLKVINDTYGHETGNDALRAVAHKLRSDPDREDTSGRLGGDEFVLLVPDITHRQAKQTAYRLERDIKGIRLDHPCGEKIRIHVSIGVASVEPGHSLEDLMSRGDAAMYRIKNRRKKART